VAVIPWVCGPKETITMPIPKSLSRRISDDLQAQIESGELQPGDKIPSARMLMATYECSITPVRLAIDRLKTLGLIVGHAGMGVFVADRTT
jgi:DNA-binding GntR family transcriptional regulator